MPKVTFSILLSFLFILWTKPFLVAQEGEGTEVQINEYLVGTLLQPEAPTKKLAIIIAGSGPTDRDGNSMMTRNNSLKLLAEGLTEQGIATYRYDKRVVTMMKNRMSNLEDVRFEDLITDAIDILTYFKEKGDFSELYLIGHSQGSQVAMVAAKDTEVAGVISIAGPSQTIDETIIEQVTAQMPNFKQELIDNFNTLKSTGSLEKYSPPLAMIFNKETQPYMLSWMKYDPKEAIKEVTAPVLIVNGTRDFQVSEKDAERLSTAKPEAKMVLITNMNHVLRVIDTDDLLVNQKSYQEPATPIASELISIITDFIKS